MISFAFLLVLRVIDTEFLPFLFLLIFCFPEVISILLNLDTQSPNAYTMSLFREGVRIAEPQTIPERQNLSQRCSRSR